jgi:2-dehydro-3-deoxyphosphogluconate aldolase/(4S)-4-hydroxy-2-oxoglutarate aldolase
MTAQSVFDKVEASRLVPVVVIHDAEDAVPAAEALLAGGINVIEITFRTPAAADSIRRISQALPDMLVGAGTLLTVDQLKASQDCGASFGLAPGLLPAVAHASMDSHFPFAPGVMTPGEVELAMSMGFSTLKFFPAEQAGGVKMLKALAGPYGHTGVRFIPTGGIDSAKTVEYLALPIVSAVGGSWMIQSSMIESRQWTTIADLTREAVELVKSIS